ncbi:class I SAM-dependent rRNA methyltransferase [Clostridia bacterium]|nr:class I SAM-dependent rRNA methyltransferase [Clostridia bacterium]
MSIRLQIRKNEVERYKKGYPLLTKEALARDSRNMVEGELFELYDGNKWMARGYIGYQNKGLGWILSLQEEEKIDKEFFFRKLGEALAKREGRFVSDETNCYRFFNGEGDGIGGMQIDCLDGYYVFHWYSKGIYQYRETILEAFCELMDYRGIYEKRRFKEKGKYLEGNDFVRGERHSDEFFVKENKVRYRVNLDDGAMYGIFLDQREVRRALIERYARGRAVLNTFSYTGAFSVAAKAGGATKTVSVDLANRSRSMTEDNFRLNAIDLSEETIIVEDIYNYFRYAKKKQLLFDMIILDPPSFSRSKKKIFQAEKDYQELIEMAIAVAGKDAILILSTNCSTLKLGKFRQFASQAFKKSGRRYRIVEEFRNPEDFSPMPAYPESNYLKVMIVEVN